MKRSIFMRVLWLATSSAVFLGSIGVALGQHEDTSHQETTLFVARADASKVVPAQRSGATATGAFILRVKGRDARLEYDLTFDGLQNGPARVIRLNNFAEGANGKLVHIICGRDAKPCPNATGATVSGEWGSGDKPPLDPALVHELAAGRIYVEIESGPRSAPEIRSQLKQQSSMGMARSFVSKLGREGNARTGMTGTAAFDFVRIDDRRTFILFDITVTGLTAPITAINMTLGAGREIPLTLPVSAALRKSRATVSGQLDGRQLPQTTRSEFVEKLRSGDFSVSLATSDPRAGALRAKLVPLH